jgi:hypothetical protein
LKNSPWDLIDKHLFGMSFKGLETRHGTFNNAWLLWFTKTEQATKSQHFSGDQSG